MTDTITGWRTVATHGSPTTADAPALIRTASGGTHFLYDSELRLVEPDTRWIPLAELDSLPDAPPPARTVTITISGEDAREVMKAARRSLPSGVPFEFRRVLSAVKDALEADETNR